MTNIGLFGETFNVLHNTLNLRNENQKYISSNIANAHTPGYAPAKFRFEDELRHYIQDNGIRMLKTNPDHFPVGDSELQVKGTVHKIPNVSGIGDDNGVNMEQEMLNLSENQIRYEAAIQMLSRKFNSLKHVIQKGG